MANSPVGNTRDPPATTSLNFLSHVCDFNILIDLGSNFNLIFFFYIICLNCVSVRIIFWKETKLFNI